ncbi:MAG: hypothetical protein KC468_19760 [Myxococcales bacterium]|nr:hypothetical protein [Myxococcales bacterium]
MEVAGGCLVNVVVGEEVESEILDYHGTPQAASLAFVVGARLSDFQGEREAQGDEPGER